MNALPARWTQAYETDLSKEILCEFATLHALRGGTYAKDVILPLIKAGDFLGLVSLDLSAAQELEDWNVLELAHTRQALGFFQKNPSLTLPGVDTTQNAVTAWRQAELQCRTMNDFLIQARNQKHLALTPSFVRLLTGVRGIIRHVLGRAPSIDSLKLRFGPGATTSIRRKNSCPQSKLAEQPTCSYALFASGRLPDVLRAMPHWSTEHSTMSTVEVGVTEDGDDYVDATDFVEVVLMDGRIEFVLKNALTKRPMESQPTINSALQLGIGDEMTRRMLRAGLQITDQNPNRVAAKFGSITNQIVTLDLTSASDMNARELVREVFPDDWFDLLSSARCASTTIEGEEVYLEKFSAMGNGFTFPLQTLLFWSICKTVCKHPDDIRVFGDDIIVHTNDCVAVCDSLRDLGFVINTKKSHVSGPFRESCGKDWYRGFSVRPYYQKRVVTAMELFSLHNYYIREGEFGEEPGFFSDRVKSYIHPDLITYGPEGYGDGHLISSDYALRRNRTMRRSGWTGGYFKTYKLPGGKQINVYPGDYVTPLYVTYISGGEPVKVRGEEVVGLRISEPLQFGPCGRPVWQTPGATDPVDSPYEVTEIYTFL